MRKQRSPWTKKQQFIFGIIVIVVTLIASLTAILIVATKPYVDAEKKVIAIAESKADIKTVMRDILALTKLNYNACLYGDGLPVTLRFSDKIGDILTAIPDVNWAAKPFKYYI